MAEDKKISQLSVADNVDGREKLVFEKNGDNGAVTVDTVKTFAQHGVVMQEAGKKLSSNDYTDADKAVVTFLVPYAEDICAYGIEFDTEVSASDCKRVGSSDLHKTLPIQSRMRGCLLNDNGDVTKYLPEGTWEEETRDGSQGQVMVEIPAHYRKFYTNGTKRRPMISEVPLPGYKFVPKQYVSAYQASVQRSTQMLASVVNTDPDYRGGNNNAAYDQASNTLLGRPATAVSRTNFRAYARKRKPATAEWNCMIYDVQKTLFWLFAIEYATLNTQATFNAEPTAEGYRQGGLGSGVTNIDSKKWSAFNGYYPFIPCGFTDSLGNGTGIVPYTMPTEYDPEASSPLITYVPRYRGVENPFGHLFMWTDGVNIRISATVENGGDGLSKVFVCHNPADFKDNGYDGYSYIGNEARDSGYVKEILFGEDGDIIPAVCQGAGSTTFFCDYHYTSFPESGESLRGLLFGGSASRGAYAGFVCAYSDNAPSGALANFGSRLCFIPE